MAGDWFHARCKLSPAYEHNSEVLPPFWLCKLTLYTLSGENSSLHAYLKPQMSFTQLPWWVILPFKKKTKNYQVQNTCKKKMSTTVSSFSWFALMGLLIISIYIVFYLSFLSVTVFFPYGYIFFFYKREKLKKNKCPKISSLVLQ